MRALSKPWFPVVVLLGVLAVVFSAALAPRPALRMPERPDWTGTWDTIWQGGGATLHLEQHGERVTGEYPLFEGAVEAEIDGRTLRGTWSQPLRQGTFEMFLAPDGETFAGRFENAQYWNGERIEKGDARTYVQADLRSPRDAIASFLNSMYWARAGQHERLQAAFQSLLFEGGSPEFVSTRALDAGLLFDVLDRTTFTLREFLGREDVLDFEASTVTLRQSGTNVDVDVTLKRNADDQWHIVWPGADALRTKLEEMLAARGTTRLDPQRHLALDSPRATMQAFLENTGVWSERQAAVATQCLDLSDIDASVRATDAQLFAFTLKRVIDSTGYVHLWGIPDDPGNPLPYVHYRHALGDIVIAPRVDALSRAEGAEQATEKRDAAKLRWAFTSDTLAGLRGLHDAIEGLQIASDIHGLPDDPYFALRQYARSVSPDLVKRHFILETWQWLGLLILALGGWWGIGWLHQAGRHAAQRSAERNPDGVDGADDRDGSVIEWRFFVPLRIALTSMVWIFGLRYLGLPDRLQMILLAISLVSGVLGGVWFAIASISALSSRLLRKARRTNTRLDEILVTLLASVGKIGAVILGLVLLAEGLALPYQSVLAGIGIGGLAVAIAARDTVANFFGSAVLISDRPFKRGDLVEVMGHLGEVERVGIRSTHIRTYEDSVVVIPNSSLVNELIDNRGRRRRRKVEVLVGVQYDSDPGLIQRLVEELRTLVKKQPTGLEGDTHVGLWDFSASSIDIRLWCYLDVQTLGEERRERHRLLLDVVRLVEELGLSFAFPTRTLHLESMPPGDEPITLGGAAAPAGVAAAPTA